MIDCFGWSIAAPDPASLAGESSEARKENEDSSKNQRMSRNSLLFHPPLHRSSRYMKERSPNSMDDLDIICFRFRN